jgi:NAD(P)-dependent dehydrogenase (short-subunit alcohol dehydrogenase family)
MDKGRRADGIAIVTGAAGGMGTPAARLLAEDGWSLLLCDVDEARLQSVAAPLRKQGVSVELLGGDIADPAFPARLTAALGTRQIGAMIHTAGLSPTMADSRRILEVNLDATVRLVDTVRPRMSEGGAVVLFASSAGHMTISQEANAAFNAPLPPEGSAALLKYAPTPQLAYPLSKRAVLRLVEREAAAFSKHKARINSVSPGIIDTPMSRAEAAESEQMKFMLEQTPLARMGRPEELAAVAVFLCSPAASYVTGTDVLVDGGTMTGLPPEVRSR